MHLQHGIPGSMEGMLDTTFWGVKASDLLTTDEKARHSMGIFANRQKQRTQELRSEDIKRALKEKGYKEETQNMRQAFHAIKGAFKDEQIHKPEFVEQEAPVDINTYTDGSFQNPRSRIWSLGGAGVWWPGRSTGLSQAEFEMGYEIATFEGLTVRTAMLGFGGSWVRQGLSFRLLE